MYVVTGKMRNCRPVCRADNLDLHCLEILGTSTSCNRKGCIGIAFTVLCYTSQSTALHIHGHAVTLVWNSVLRIL